MYNEQPNIAQAMPAAQPDAPVANNANRRQYRFAAKNVHLTFPGHIPHAEILDMLWSKGQLRWWSVVWEVGHEGEDYDHTHAACEWFKRVDGNSARFFDVGAAHPNIQKINNAQHAVRLYEDYHKKAPVLLTQSEVSPRASVASYQGIRDAPTIFEAAQALDIQPKSYSDLKIIRDEKKKKSLHVHSFPDTIWTLHIDPNFRTLYLWGPSDTGKTQFALSLLDSPLLVRQKDQLREYDATIHGGIVIDDINMSVWPRESRIMIADWDEEAAIDCRYSPAIIPKHTKVIITSNVSFQDNMLGGVEDTAIRRRFTRIIHITGKTYEINPVMPAVPDVPHPLFQQPLLADNDEVLMGLGDEINGLFPEGLFDDDDA